MFADAHMNVGIPRGRFRWRTIGIAVTILAAIFLWRTRSGTPWRFQRELPASAQDVHEWAHEDGFLPDHEYLLKARITEKEFHEYVDRLRLTPNTPTRQYAQAADAYLRWRPGTREETNWFDPSESLAGTFVTQSGDIWTYAKFERAYVYLRSFEH